MTCSHAAVFWLLLLRIAELHTAEMSVSSGTSSGAWLGALPGGVKDESEPLKVGDPGEHTLLTPLKAAGTPCATCELVLQMQEQLDAVESAVQLVHASCKVNGRLTCNSVARCAGAGVGLEILKRAEEVAEALRLFVEAYGGPVSSPSRRSQETAITSTSAFEDRGTKSTSAFEDRGSEPAASYSRVHEQSRAFVPAMRPTVIITKDVLLPSLTFLYKSPAVFYICIALAVVFATGGYFCTSIWDSWLLALFCGVMTMPPVIIHGARLHVGTVIDLCQTFDILWITSQTFRMLASFVVLFREYPPGIIFMLFLSPLLLTSQFQDACPEKVRVKDGRLFFGLFVAGLVVSTGMLLLDKMNVKDLVVESPFEFVHFQTTARNQAIFAMGNLLVFGVKNLFSSIRYPGSLVLIQSEVVSIKLDVDMLDAFRLAHAMLVKSSSRSNATMHDLSSRSSIQGLGRSVLPFDAVQFGSPT